MYTGTTVMCGVNKVQLFSCFSYLESSYQLTFTLFSSPFSAVVSWQVAPSHAGIAPLFIFGSQEALLAEPEIWENPPCLLMMHESLGPDSEHYLILIVISSWSCSLVANTSTLLSHLSEPYYWFSYFLWFFYFIYKAGDVCFWLLGKGW